MGLGFILGLLDVVAGAVFISSMWIILDLHAVS